MADQKPNTLILERFLPYRISYLDNIISRQLAKIYGERFDIVPAEWKVMAVLHRFPDSSAASVADKTAMDKVAVSRAVKSLIEKGYLDRIYAQDDRRRSIMHLSEKGEALYNEIAPLVKAYEQKMRSHLSKDELAQLDSLLVKLTEYVKD